MTLVVIIILTALLFDFINGFHDASNSIATIIATKVLKPFHAVCWAAFFNFAALFVFDADVVKAVGQGLIDLSVVTPMVILAGLIGAIFWNLFTWWLGLPSSSSHALIGGYAGSAVAHQAAVTGHFEGATSVLLLPGWSKVLLFIVLAPVVGWVLGVAFMLLAKKIEKHRPERDRSRLYGHMQLASSAFLSLTHGSNDAQKTAGIIAAALVASGHFTEFHAPFWLLGTCYLVMGLGTLAGGWRIVQTMAFKLTHLDRRGGVCAEMAAASSILMATLLKVPISTTQATTGAVIGTGSGQRQEISWDTVKRILVAWALTIPAAAAMGGAVSLLFHYFA